MGEARFEGRGGGPGLQGRIHDEVRRRIVGGLLAPGERLVELKLAREFGTSQAPVREALRRLSQEGLVVSVPRRGTFVTEPSLEEIEDVYLLRAEVESLAVRHFVVNAGDEAIGELYRCLEDMRAAGEARDHVAAGDADMRFHRAICKGSGSALFEEVWTTIDNRVRGIQTLVQARAALAVQLVEKHEPILRALVRRDAEAAEDLIRAHVKLGWSDTRRMLAAEASEPAGDTAHHRRSR